MHVKFQQLPINSGWCLFSSSRLVRTVSNCAFLYWLLICPLLCNARCAVHARHGRRHPCRGAEDVSFGPVQQTTKISQLQSLIWWSSYVLPVPQFVRSCEETVEIPQLQLVFLDPVVHTPVVCNDSCLVDVLAQVIDGSHVPVIMQRRFLSGSAPVSVFAGEGGHSSCATEKGTRLVMAAKVFFDAFCVIFRGPPVVPELSASLSSFRALTEVSARWTGVLESPGVYSQVTRHRVCANSSSCDVDIHAPERSD